MKKIIYNGWMLLFVIAATVFVTSYVTGPFISDPHVSEGWKVFIWLLIAVVAMVILNYIGHYLEFQTQLAELEEEEANSELLELQAEITLIEKREEDSKKALEAIKKPAKPEPVAKAEKAVAKPRTRKPKAPKSPPKATK